MKLTGKIESVLELWAFDQVYIKKEGLLSIHKGELVEIIKGNIASFSYFNDYLIYLMNDHHGKLFCKFSNGETKILVDDSDVEFYNLSNLLIDSKLPVYYSEKEGFLPIGMYLINSQLNVEQLEQVHSYAIKSENHYFRNTPKQIHAYNLDHQNEYILNISDYGRNIKKARDSGKILSDEPNEIDGNLFCYEGLLYVPLAGGQLLALNAESGKEIWMLEHEVSGAYQIIDSKIYKKDIKQIFEIDALTGEVLKHKELRKDPQTKEFSAAGPLWVYKDIIIATDVLKGEICLLERSSLSVIEFFTINKKLPFNNNAIAWYENELYVLDLENTLHIFKKEI